MVTMEPELPPEMWILVLRFSSTKDLCSMAQVSHELNQIATDPILWADRGADINTKKVRKEGMMFLTLPRFRNLKFLDLSSLPRRWADEAWCQVSEYMESSSSLISVDLSNNKIPSEPLNQLLKICSTESSLHEIKIKNVDLSKVPPLLLAQAASDLRKFDLQNCNLTENHCTTLFTCILKVEVTKLKELNLGDSNLSRIPASLLASAVSIVESVNLANTKLVTQQMIALLNQILNPTNKLLNLSLEDVNLANETDSFYQPVITPKLFSSSICQLKSINLRQTYVTSQLINALLTQIVTGPSSLSSINLRHVQRTHICADLLGEALSSLRQVSLSYMKSSEMDTLLLYFANSQTLEELDLENVFFGHANVQLTARAICRLTKVSLKNARLTVNHLTSLFSAMAVATSLKQINLQGVNISMVSEKLLGAAISRVSMANLTKTNLTNKHMKAICDASQSSSTIKHIQIEDITSGQANSDIMDPPRCTCVQKEKCIFSQQMPRLDKNHKMDLLKNTLIKIGIFLLVIFLLLIPILEFIF